MLMLSRVLQLPFVLILDMNTETEDDKGEQPAYCYYRQSAAFRMFFLPNLLLLLLWMNACNETAVLFLAFIQHRRIREETEC